MTGRQGNPPDSPWRSTPTAQRHVKPAGILLTAAELAELDRLAAIHAEEMPEHASRPGRRKGRSGMVAIMIARWIALENKPAKKK